MNTRTTPIGTARGFTLVELLVVIAIITVIAAFLLPVFTAVREKARQSACASNEKQLAVGVLMYAQDFDEVLPAARNDLDVLWPDEIDAYLRNDRVRACPSDADGVVGSYGLNELTFVDMPDFLPDLPSAMPVLAQFQTPSETVMLGELGTQDDLKTPRLNAYKLTVPDNDLNDPSDARPSARHFSRTNLAFMDGHVKALRLEQFYTDQTPTDRWFCVDSSMTDTCATLVH